MFKMRNIYLIIAKQIVEESGIQNAEKKWTMPIHNWSLTISQLNIHFKERLKNALDLV